MLRLRSSQSIANDAYFLLEGDGSGYANYSGTGNTLNANHPVMRRMIVDSLRCWVQGCTSMVFVSTSHRFWRGTLLAAFRVLLTALALER